MTYENRVACVVYIIMIDLNRCNGSDYNGLENISMFSFQIGLFNIYLQIIAKEKKNERKREYE